MSVMVAGCALLAPPEPPSDTFDLAAPTRFAEPVGSSSAQLAVTEPTTVGALDSERILVRPSPLEVTYLARSRWSDRVSRLVQRRLIDAFQNSEGISSVGLPGGAVANDVGLVTDLRTFHVDAAAGVAEIEIMARLVAERDGRVIASRRIEADSAVSGDGAADMAAALNAAFAEAAQEIVTWTLAEI